MGNQQRNTVFKFTKCPYCDIIVLDNYKPNIVS
nr:MAG TPA: ArsC family reductase [Caudoviricetes sp.]